MISPGENRIQSVLNSHEELQKIGQFFSSFNPFPSGPSADKND